MPPLTATNKKFLKEGLHVEAKKKKGWGIGREKDVNVDSAKASFEGFRDKEQVVIQKITRLRTFDVSAQSEADQLERDVEAAQAIVKTDVGGNAQAAQANINRATQQLDGVGSRLDTALMKAEDRKAFKTELDKANLLLSSLTPKNKDGIAFDKPLVDLIAAANNMATGNQHGPAARKLATDAKPMHTRQMAKANDYGTLVTELAKAEELARNLVTLNRPDGNDQYEKPLTDAIAAAKRNIDDAKANPQDDGVAKARASLVDVKADHKEQVKKAATDRTSQLNADRFKPVYLDKVLRIQEAMDELTPLPGTKAAVLELRALIAKGAEFALRDDYENAYKALAGLTASLTRGRKAAADFRDTAGGTECAKPFQSAQAALQSFRNAAGLGQSDLVSASQKQLDDALKEIEGRPAPTRVRELAQELTKLASDLTQATQAQNTHRTVALESQKASSKLFDELKTAAPIGVWEGFREELVATDTLLGIQQYENAKRDYDAIINKMTPLHTTATKNRADWDDLVRQYQAAKPDLDEAAAIICNAVSTGAGRINSTFANYNGLMQQTHDYALGSTELKKALDTLPDVRKNLGDYNGMKDAIAEAKNAIYARIKKVDVAFEGFLDCDLADFEARLPPLRPDTAGGPVYVKFNALFESAAKVTEFRDQCLKDLDQIITDLHKAMGTTGERDRRVGQARSKSDTKLFQTLKTDVTRLLGTLEEDDPAKAKSRRDEFDHAVAAVGPGGAQAADVQALTKVKNDVAADIKANQDQVKKDQAAARTMAQELLNDIAKLEKANDAYAELFTDLRDRISECRGMYESTLVASVAKGTQKLKDLKLEVTNLKNDNAKGATATKTFKAVDKKIEEIKDLIVKSKVLKDCLPSKQAVLKYRIEKEVADEARKAPPAKALDEILHNFEVDDVTKTIALAQAAQTQRDELKERGKKLKARLETLAEAPKLKKSFEGRIDAACAPGEQAEPKCKIDLDIIEQLIESALTDVDSRTKMETKCVGDELKAERAAKEWEAKLDVYNKNAKRRADAAHKITPEKDRDAKLYKEIGDTFHEAEKLAEAGNHVIAVRKLDEAIALANRFADNPLGGPATAQKNLRGVAEKWKTAVAAYVGDINKMVGVMNEQNKTPPVADLAKIKQELTRVSKLFDPQLFVDIAGPLPDMDLANKRTSKEHALRRLRAYRDMLTNDKVLAYLTKNNPFSPAFSTKNLTATLNLLEVNLLRA